jgi:hypothetical protein
MRTVLQIGRAYGAGKKRDATMAKVPPLALAVLVLMGFSISGKRLIYFFGSSEFLLETPNFSDQKLT